MDLDYFPGIDITENTFAWLVNGVAGTTFLGINLLVFLSFPLVAALAYLVIRMIGLRGPLAIALAVAFAFIPYHWGRALGHTYLSTLYRRSSASPWSCSCRAACSGASCARDRAAGASLAIAGRGAHVRRGRVERRLLRRLHPDPRRSRAALAHRPARRWPSSSRSTPSPSSARRCSPLIGFLPAC